MIQSEFPTVSWLPTLKPLVIETEPENRPDVSIFELQRQKTLFSGALWPDFSGRLEIDLKPLVKDLFVPSLPSSAARIQRNYASLKMKSEDDDQYTYAEVNLFSEDSLTRMSDADELEVPKDYVLPISYADDDTFSYAVIETRSGEIDIMDRIDEGSGDNLGRIAMILDIGSLHLGGDDTFRVRISSAIAPDLRSPVYHITSKRMEQYLFYNRLGGWDNIAMGGRRTFAPEMEFSSHLESGRRMPTRCKATLQYVQNSGWMTMESATALSRLLASPAIYHLSGGVWRRIVITAGDVTIESDASQHSLSFTYRYSEEN